jgi:hypothetical protein
MELFPKDYVLELNIKNLGNSPSFLTNTHTTLSAKWFRSYGILTIDVAAEFFFLDRTTAEPIFTFGFQIGQNSGSPKYQIGKLSQLSDGP